MTAKGASKIVPTLKEGAGVVTTRAHAQYIVTEFGVAELKGRNLAQRAKALINVAHPEAKETLERAAHERFGSSLYYFNSLNLSEVC
jgi:acyl-CoA hydrolase